MTAIAVTGASGFIGSHLRSYFERVGYDVRCINSADNKFQSAGHPYLLDERLEGVKVLIHAGWRGSRRPLRLKAEVQRANVAFAEVLARSIKRQRVETVIGLGSQAEFVPINGPWLDNSPVRGTDPYSQAKIHVRQALEDSGADTIWMRLFSAYGPGDESDWVLSRVVEGVRSNEAVILGPCENPWSFLYVDDVVSAISYGVDRKVSGSVVVTGTFSRPLRDWLTEAAWALSGRAGGLIFSRDGESGRSMDARPEKLLAAGWHPKVDFHTGIREYADWMRGPLAIT